MMDSKIFYQILYQNDTLFRTNDPITAPQASAEHNRLPVEFEKDLIEKSPVETVMDETPVTHTIPTASPIQPFPIPVHSLLVLTDNPLQASLGASEQVFLSKILKAVQQDLDQTDVYNFSYLPGYNATPVLTNKQINYFITFGVPLIKLELDVLLVPYIPKQVNGIWFLYAAPLAEIEKDVEAKKKLWNALKQMFQK
jgi:hypothetical protein